MSTMTASAGGASLSVPARPLWIVVAAVLAIGAVAFGVAFDAEVLAAVHVWEASTAYNHCYLIVPITAYLIWERRAALLILTPQPVFWPLLAMIPVGLTWLFAVQLGIMEGRQLMVMTLFQIFVFSVLGYRAWRVIAFALLYLYFLVPFGEFLTPQLQDIAARLGVFWLNALDIPNYYEPAGQTVEVPGATFIIAEACAGLRFLIASIALGALYGYMMYRSMARRAAFLVASIIVPLIANGFRVFGIIWLGYILSSAEAAAADHLIYGWIFFSIVSLLLIVAGLPFRQAIPAWPVAADGLAVTPRAKMLAVGVGAVAVLFVAVLAAPAIAQGPVGGAMGAAASGLKHTLGR